MGHTILQLVGMSTSKPVNQYMHFYDFPIDPGYFSFLVAPLSLIVNLTHSNILISII
jgi:hypothetical protein